MALALDAPPALTQVAQRYTQTSSGIVAFELHRVFDVHAGFSKRHEDLVMNGVYDAGTLVRVHVVSYTIDGKTASSADVANLEESWNHPNTSEAFALPYDSRNFDAYQYRSDGPSTIDFTSAMRDPAHGSGSFTYDDRGNVISCTYHPNVLPPHADSGEITDRRAEVLSGYWATAQETQEYKGSIGPFSGAGTIDATYSDFRRFDNLERALSAIGP